MAEFVALNWLDLTVFGLLGTGLLIGASYGFVRMVLGFVRMAASTALAVVLYSRTRDVVGSQFADPTSSLADVAAGGIVFLGSWLLVMIAFWILREAFRRLIYTPASRTVDRGVRKSGLSPINRFLGAAFGLLLAAVPAMLLLAVLYLNRESTSGEQLKHSLCGPVAVGYLDDIAAEIPERHQRELREMSERTRQQVVHGAARLISELLDAFREQVDEQLPQGQNP